MSAARRAAVLGDAVAARDVAEAVADQAHAHQRRGLSDRPDSVLLVDHDLPDLLRGVDPLLGLLARRRAVEVEDLEDLRIIRLLALRAARRVPLAVVGAHEGL